MGNDSRINGAASDEIRLSLPINAAYVSAARHTASSVGGGLGFSADELEDIKTSVSEACTYIIKKLQTRYGDRFQLVFFPGKGFLDISLKCSAEPADTDHDDDYGLQMIKALMEQVSISCENGIFMLTMSKTHKTNSFM